MKWLKKMAIKMALPMIKAQAKKAIESEEYQKMLVKAINKKVDIPELSEESEKKLLDQVYDATQEVAGNLLEKIDVDAIVEKL